MTTRTIEVGDRVRIRKGISGEGYTFVVARLNGQKLDPVCGHVEHQIEGYNYGPVRYCEVEFA
jgi:hypothetical protein